MESVAAHRRFRSRLGCAPRTSLHRRLLTSRTSGADRFLPTVRRFHSFGTPSLARSTDGYSRFAPPAHWQIRK